MRLGAERIKSMHSGALFSEWALLRHQRTHRMPLEAMRIGGARVRASGGAAQSHLQLLQLMRKSADLIQRNISLLYRLVRRALLRLPCSSTVSLFVAHRSVCLQVGGGAAWCNRVLWR